MTRVKARGHVSETSRIRPANTAILLQVGLQTNRPAGDFTDILSLGMLHERMYRGMARVEFGWTRVSGMAALWRLRRLLQRPIRLERQARRCLHGVILGIGGAGMVAGGGGLAAAMAAGGAAAEAGKYGDFEDEIAYGPRLHFFLYCVYFSPGSSDRINHQH